MNVVRIIYEWPTPWLPLSPVSYELTKSQIKLGHKLTVFSARWPNAGEVVSVDGADVNTVWRAPFQGTVAVTSSILLFFKYLSWRKKHKADIIHSHGHFAIWIYLYRVFLDKFFPWAKELKTPLIAHFHNTVKGRWEKLSEGEKQISLVSQFLDYPLGVLSDKWAVKAAAGCVFVSEQLREDAIKFYKADPNKCFVVESGVNTDTFMPVSLEERDKSRADLGIEPTDKVILNLGMLVERKNIHVLYKAMTFLPRTYKLVLVGADGDPAYIDELNKIVEENRAVLEDRIIKVGATPYPQVPIAYQIADLFVLPSSWEGLPKVVMEALSCKVPVLASGFKTKDEIRGLEYLDDLSPEAVAKRIIEMIENPREVDLYNIIHNHSWDVKAKQIEGIYEFAIKTFMQ